MKIIKPSYEILTPIDTEDIYRKIERIGRICYKSEAAISEESGERFVRNLVKRGHEAMLEHAHITVIFTVDRGVSHELVRHRMASFAQESTRYCNYSQDKFGSEITVIEPCYLEHGSPAYCDWKQAMKTCEESYLEMLTAGSTPQKARAVLPNSLKTEIAVTANLREWRHILKLRAAGVTGQPHPQMAEIMIPLLKEFQEKLPAVFDDIAMKTAEK